MALPAVGDLGLFDCNCMLGPQRAPQPGAPATVTELLAEMDRLGIAEALVYHSHARYEGPAAGNARLLEEIAGQPRLHPCWVLVPRHAGELPAGDELLDAMRAAGVRAARVFPDEHFFSLDPWCFGDTLAALAEAHVPLIVDWGKTHWSQALRGWESMQRVAAAYPELPLIPVREGMAIDRFVGALIEQGPGLHLEVSYYNGHRAIETFVANYGVGRLLFGTGLPFFDPALAIGIVATAGLPAAQAQAIAGGNLRRLLGGVAW